MPNNNNIKDPRDASPAVNDNKLTQEDLGAGDQDRARRQLDKEDIKTMENMEVFYNSDTNSWEKEVTRVHDVQNLGSASDETQHCGSLKKGFAPPNVVSAR